MAPVPPDSDYHSTSSSGAGCQEEQSQERHVPHEIVRADDPAADVVAVEWNRQSVISDDEESGNVLDRDYTGMFEGPEKTLEVVFRRADGNNTEHQVVSTGDLVGEPVSTVSGPIKRAGLRRLPRADLDRICARARCTILSVVSNRYLDAYVLSESSLFVYPYMYVKMEKEKKPGIGLCETINISLTSSL